MFFWFYNAFTVSYLIIPWLYAPEIYNLQMRAQGLALASASNWLCKFLSSLPGFVVHTNKP
jgi:hypothetical protein